MREEEGKYLTDGCFGVTGPEWLVFFFFSKIYLMGYINFTTYTKSNIIFVICTMQICLEEAKTKFS